MFSEILVPALNVMLAGGIPLPSLPGITLQHPTLTQGDQYLLLAADFAVNTTSLLPVVQVGARALRG
jgi:hypothetical protein